MEITYLNPNGTIAYYTTAARALKKSMELDETDACGIWCIEKAYNGAYYLYKEIEA